jgi:hypothetical protein
MATPKRTILRRCTHCMRCGWPRYAAKRVPCVNLYLRHQYVKYDRKRK